LSFRDKEEKTFRLIDYPINMKEGEDFIILEGLRSKHVKNSTKWVHIVRSTAVNNKFKIGSISEEKETLFIGD